MGETGTLYVNLGLLPRGHRQIAPFVTLAPLAFLFCWEKSSRKEKWDQESEANLGLKCSLASGSEITELRRWKYLLLLFYRPGN